MAVGALVNGGYMINPTFLKRRAEVDETQDARRHQAGDLGVAALPHAPQRRDRLGQKGQYCTAISSAARPAPPTRSSTAITRKNKLFTTFMAIVPADKPNYLFMTLMDEPQGLPRDGHFRTAAWNSGYVTGKIIERVGPLLGLAPRFELPTQPFPAAGQTGLWLRQHAPDAAEGALMRLDELLPERRHSPRRLRSHAASTADSRAVAPGFVFFAVAGRARPTGSRFAPQALRARRRRHRRRDGARRRSGRRAFVQAADVARAPCRAPPRALLSAPARDHRRRHRHQRQDLGRRFHPPDLGGAAASRPPRSARIGVVAPSRRGLWLADDARSRHSAQNARRSGRRRRHPSRAGGVLARPRPAPARRRAARRPAPSPISRATISIITRRSRGLSRRQAAAVRRPAASRAQPR